MKKHSESDTIKTRKRVHENGENDLHRKIQSRASNEVLREEEQNGGIASRHNLNPNLLRKWKSELLEKSSMIFDESRQASEYALKEREAEAKQEELLKTVGQLFEAYSYLRLR